MSLLKQRISLKKVDTYLDCVLPGGGIVKIGADILLFQLLAINRKTFLQKILFCEADMKKLSSQSNKLKRGAVYSFFNLKDLLEMRISHSFS